MGDALKSMGSCETNDTLLSTGFSRLSEIMAQLQISEYELANNSSREFVEVLSDYGRILVNVQRVLDWRLLKLGDYQFAEKDLEQKRQKAAAKPSDSKLQGLVSAAELKHEETREIFESASELVRSEIERFESTKGKEIQGAIIQFAQCNLTKELCMLDSWRKFVAEIQ